VSKLADDMYRMVRGYLNEGGKLLFTGEQAGYNLVQQFVYNTEGGPPYCDSPDVPLGACIPLSNDFLQYYLGAWQSNTLAEADKEGKAKMDGMQASFGPSPFGPLTVSFNGAESADNQDYAYTLSPTSTVLPPDEYPLFRSEGIGGYSLPGPLAPPTGDFYAYSQPGDSAFKRLTRTIDLTGASGGSLKFKTSYITEQDYDFLFVEAHTVGQDDWTTLPDENGHTSDYTGFSCEDGWSTASGDHPFLAHYQTSTAQGCQPTGTTGEWNASHANSNGYQDWEVDLSEFAGEQVEVSISYATDPFVQETGVLVDDTEVIVDGATVASTSFEDGLGGWTAAPPPAGSEQPSNWIRTEALFEEAAGVRTEDTVYYGFGLEGIRGNGARADLLERSLRFLGVTKGGPPITPPPGGGPPGGGPGPGPGADEFVLRIKRKRLKVGPKRRFLVRLRCPETVDDRCQGILTVTAGRDVLGRKEFDIPADKFRNVRLRMGKEAFRDLVEKGPRRARVLLLTRGSDGELRSLEVKRRVKRKGT
jgi:hypothetical protein